MCFLSFFLSFPSFFSFFPVLPFLFSSSSFLLFLLYSFFPPLFPYFFFPLFPFSTYCCGWRIVSYTRGKANGVWVLGREPVGLDGSALQAVEDPGARDLQADEGHGQVDDPAEIRVSEEAQVEEQEGHFDEELFEEVVEFFHK